MSVQNHAALVVGRQRKDFNDKTRLEKLLDDQELEECTTEYDGGGCKFNPVGFFYKQTGEQSASELEMDDVEVARLADQFQQLTGMEAKIYLSTYCL